MSVPPRPVSRPTEAAVFTAKQVAWFAVPCALIALSLGVVLGIALQRDRDEVMTQPVTRAERSGVTDDPFGTPSDAPIIARTNAKQEPTPQVEPQHTDNSVSDTAPTEEAAPAIANDSVTAEIAVEDQVQPPALTLAERLAETAGPTSAARGHVLIDATRDGGAWWYPQTRGPKNIKLVYQGKMLADYLRSRGLTVRELSELDPAPITDELLSGYELVLRVGEYYSMRPYEVEELDAYERYVAGGGHLVLVQDYVRANERDQLGARFGLTIAGTTTGSQWVHFTQDPLSRTSRSGRYVAYAGSGVLSAPRDTRWLARVDDHTFLDRNDNRRLDADEVYGARIMGLLEYGRGILVFVTDANFIEAVPQPLSDEMFDLLAASSKRYWQLHRR